MGIVLKKEVIYQILFFACIAVPYASIYELTFAVWSLAALLTLKNKYSLTILQHVACFAGIFTVAFAGGLFKGAMLYNFLRDIAYLLKPIIGLLLGYQLCKRYIKNPLVFIINTGIAIAILHFILIIHAVTVYRITDMHKLREYSGYFSDFEVYALIVLMFYKQLNIEIPKKKYQIGIALLSVSVILYLARTNFIQFVILYIALKGYFVINKRSVIVVSTFLLIVLGGYAAIYSYNPKRNAKGIETLLYKIKIAPTEPFKSKIDIDNWKDFHDNYRSYETILTLKQVPQGGPAAVLFGEGMGSSVDLKREVWLQTSFMRYIPFLHNGFMTVYLKSGLTGIMILLMSISLFFRNKRTSNPEVKKINHLLVGTGIFLIMSYWVFMGLYFVADTKSIVIGFILAYREVIINREKESAILPDHTL